MLPTALVINICVLVPVLYGMIQRRGWVGPTFGGDTTARRILVCVYGAITCLSAVLLLWTEGRVALAPGLLAMQVIYKLATLAVIGPAYPVARVNGAIAICHTLALGSLL